MSTRVRLPPRAPINQRIAERRDLVRRSQRRRRRVRVALVTAVVALAVGVVIGGRSPLAAVTQLQVTGLDDKRAEEVRSELPDVVGTPVGALDVTDLRDRVEALAWVASADVARELPPRVRIAVTAREAVAALRTDGGVWSIDDQGVVLAGGAPPSLPVIQADAGALARLGEPCAPEVRTAVAVATALPADLEARLDHIQAGDRRTVRLVLAVEGRTVDVIFGNADQAGRKAVALRLLLHRIPALDLAGTTLDVRAPDNPVWVPTAAKETAG